MGEYFLDSANGSPLWFFQSNIFSCKAEFQNTVYVYNTTFMLKQ